MSETTDQLIGRLTAEATPVRRLRPPILRAALWLAAAAAGSAVAVYALADMGVFLRRAAEGRQAIELAATLATGILAMIAAFHLSLPDRNRAWALLPVPALALWLATAGYGCLQNWVRGVPSDLAESLECLQIILAASLPLGIAALWMLSRARPLAPTPVAAMGGLGVAAIAAFLLQFFHPFDVTVIDLAIHALAVALVVGISAVSARFATA